MPTEPNETQAKPVRLRLSRRTQPICFSPAFSSSLAEVWGPASDQASVAEQDESAADAALVLVSWALVSQVLPAAHRDRPVALRAGLARAVMEPDSLVEVRVGQKAQASPVGSMADPVSSAAVERAARAELASDCPA